MASLGPKKKRFLFENYRYFLVLFRSVVKLTLYCCITVCSFFHFFFFFFFFSWGGVLLSTWNWFYVFRLVTRMLTTSNVLSKNSVWRVIIPPFFFVLFHTVPILLANRADSFLFQTFSNPPSPRWSDGMRCCRSDVWALFVLLFSTLVLSPDRVDFDLFLVFLKDPISPPPFSLPHTIYLPPFPPWVSLCICVDSNNAYLCYVHVWYVYVQWPG